MAAILNLPSSTAISAAADKAAQTRANSNGESGGFSQALNQQIEKKQASVENKANAMERAVPAAKSASIHTTTADIPPLSHQNNEAEQSDAAQAVNDATISQESTEQSVLSLEVAITQPMSLQELLGLAIGNTVAAGETESGNELPDVASTRSIGFAELLVTRNGRELTADIKEQSQAVQLVDDKALAVLQQRVAQQLAVPTEGAEATEGLKQSLLGVENALQGLDAKSSEAKGLEQAREQLLMRLQGLQGQNAQSNGGNAEQQGNASKLPVMQTMSKDADGKLSDVAKLTRAAFQEMLAQHSPNQSQVTSGQLASGTAVSMHSLSAMLRPSEGGNPLLNYAPASGSVNVPVNHPAWGQAIGERLQWMVKQEVQQAEIKLNPRNMGPIEIKIAMNQDQATVSFVANHAMTREALDAALPKLREMFGESGLNLVDVNVSQNPDTNGQRANERTDDPADGRLARFGGDTTDELEADALAQSPGQGPIWHSSNGVLDAYA